MKMRSLCAVAIAAIFMSMPALADDNENISNIDQLGDSISATVSQFGDDNVKNESDVDQGLGGGGSDLNAMITQHGIGTDNYSQVIQNGTMNEATVLQNGTGNTSKSWIDQNGTGAGPNMADVNQGGMNNINNSTIMQDGSNLTAIVVQN